MDEYQKRLWNEAKKLSVFQNTIYKGHFWFFFGYKSIDICRQHTESWQKDLWCMRWWGLFKFFLCCCLIWNWSLFPLILIVCSEFRGFMLVYLACFHFILPCHAGNGLWIRHCKGHAFAMMLLKAGLSPAAHICWLMLLHSSECWSKVQSSVWQWWVSPCSEKLSLALLS